jgi:hypothetical protein
MKPQGKITSAFFLIRNLTTSLTSISILFILLSEMLFLLLYDKLFSYLYIYINREREKKTNDKLVQLGYLI